MASNVLSTIKPWDEVAIGYAETTMGYFEIYAQKALALTKIDKASRILDVACGPGTLPLLASPLVQSVDAIDFSPKMIELLDKNKRALNKNNVYGFCGDGQALPFDDDTYDAAYSLFGLMFFPDRNKGYREMYRVLKPGGSAVVSSWAPVADSPAMQIMFGAIRAINPDIPEPKTNLESLENPQYFIDEMSAAGFQSVQITPVQGEYLVESIETFWANMVKGSAPLNLMKLNKSPDEWLALEAKAIDYLKTAIPTMPTSLTVKAWLASGEKIGA